MSSTITTFLMFVGKQHGKAEEAITSYTTLFDNSEIIKIERYGPNEGQPEGTVKIAEFILSGQRFMAMDSGLQHSFTFTPAMSLFAAFETEEKIDQVFNQLSEHGMVLMELDKYPFSKKFGWVEDKYGVSWQLNLQ